METQLPHLQDRRQVFIQPNEEFIADGKQLAEPLFGQNLHLEDTMPKSTHPASPGHNIPRYGHEGSFHKFLSQVHIFGEKLLQNTGHHISQLDESILRSTVFHYHSVNKTEESLGKSRKNKELICRFMLLPDGERVKPCRQRSGVDGGASCGTGLQRGNRTHNV